MLGKRSGARHLRGVLSPIGGRRLPVGWAGRDAVWSGSGLLSPFLPRPASGDLQFEGEAEKGTDQDDSGKYPDAGERRLDGDRADDVAGDQELQPEQNRAPELATVPPVDIGSAPAPVHGGEDRRGYRAYHDHRYPDGFDALSDRLDRMLEIHSGAPAP